MAPPKAPPPLSANAAPLGPARSALVQPKRSGPAAPAPLSANAAPLGPARTPPVQAKAAGPTPPPPLSPQAAPTGRATTALVQAKRATAPAPRPRSAVAQPAAAAAGGSGGGGPPGGGPGGWKKATHNVGDYGFYPLGFADEGDFQLFLHMIYKHSPVRDLVVVIQGSSVTGVSYISKLASGERRFDVGRDSDYDVALVSPTLFERAIGIGVKIRGGGHTEPLTEAQMQALGLDRAHEAAEGATSRWVGDLTTGRVVTREVNFMIYTDLETARGHTGPSLLGRRSYTGDYRETGGELHGDVDFAKDSGGKKGK